MTDSKQTQPLAADTMATLRLGHLQMIQGVVGRMSSYSASVKNFNVTIVAGLLAFYSQKPDGRVFIFALFAVVALALLDTHYLRLEKAYRSLFDEVRNEPIHLPTDFRLPPDMKSNHSVRDVICSWSVLGFYAPIIAALIIFYAALKVWPL